MLHVAVTWLTLYCLLYTCVGLCVALCLIEGKVCMTGGRVEGGDEQQKVRCHHLDG